MTKKTRFFLLFLLINIIQLFIFFPQLSPRNNQIIFTPDFGQSDIYHLNISSKKILSENLKNYKFPLWTNKIGNGVPIFAEGQIGTFNIFNLLIFYFFSLPTAFSFLYLAIFLFNSIGTYLLGKSLNFSFLQRIFLTTTYTFSGFIIVQMTHTNLLLALSYLPWLLFFILEYLKTEKPEFLIIFSIFLSQQIFAGHLQTTFITLFFIFSFIFFKLFLEKKLRFKPIIFIISAVIVGIIASSIQILPTLELKNVDYLRKNLTFEDITKFRFLYSDLKNFFNPYLSGNPRNGKYTYLISEENDFHFFWENTGYVGLTALILFIYFLINLIKIKNKRKRDLSILAFIFPFLISFLLLFGKASPLYFIFTIFPFNLFRVPSRFLMLVSLIIIIFATYSLKSISQKVQNNYLKKILIITLISISFFDLYLNFSDYHLFINKEDLFSLPKSKTTIKDAKIYTYRNAHFGHWNYYLTNLGWQNAEPYLYFRNYLLSNSNLMFDTKSLNTNMEMLPSRLVWNLKLIDEGILGKKNYELASTPFVDNFLDIYSITHFITSQKMTNTDLELQEVIRERNLPPIYIYQNKNVLPEFRIIDNAIYTETIKNLIIKVNNKEFDPSKTTTLEKKELINEVSNKKVLEAKYEILEKKDKYIKMKTKSNKKAFLIYNNSFYPNWKAFINGEETEIYPANINQKMIILPKGEKIVEFKYLPQSFYKGTKITLITHLVLILTLILFVNKNLKTPQLFAHLHNN